jgi:hypothetical protein
MRQWVDRRLALIRHRAAAFAATAQGTFCIPEEGIFEHT